MSVFVGLCFGMYILILMLLQNTLGYIEFWNNEQCLYSVILTDVFVLRKHLKNRSGISFSITPTHFGVWISNVFPKTKINQNLPYEQKTLSDKTSFLVIYTEQLLTKEEKIPNSTV